MTLQEFLTSEGRISDCGWLIVSSARLLIIGRATSEKDAIAFAKKHVLSTNEQVFIYTLSHMVSPSIVELPDGDTVKAAKTVKFASPVADA